MRLPKRLSECEAGMIIRTRVGILRIGWTHEHRLPCVRLVEPGTLHAVSDPFSIFADLEIEEVLRDQTYYRSHPRAGGREVDPVANEQTGGKGDEEKATRDPGR